MKNFQKKINYYNHKIHKLQTDIILNLTKLEFGPKLSDKEYGIINQEIFKTIEQIIENSKKLKIFELDKQTHNILEKIKQK